MLTRKTAATLKKLDDFNKSYTSTSESDNAALISTKLKDGFRLIKAVASEVLKDSVSNEKDEATVKLLEEYSEKLVALVREKLEK
jgi:hypothetical protein